MEWTFEAIARRWEEITFVAAARKELLPPFLQQLTGPERGWFKACYAWGHGGPSPDDFPEQIPQVLAALDAYRRTVAEVHQECARAVRDVLAPESQWTSMPPLSQAQLTHLHELLAALPARFPASPPPLGLPFFCDLADELLDRPRRAGPRRLALFPLIGEESADDLLAMFVLERLSGEAGEIFLAPEQAFTPMDKSFYQIFEDAVQVLREHKELQCESGGDVRVRIEKWHPFDSLEDALIHAPLAGGSGGGALVLSLWSVWTGIPLEPGVVTSFALTNPDVKAEEGKRPDGRCYRIRGEIRKARAIAEEKGGDGIFLVSQAQGGELNERAREMQLHVEMVTDLEKAVEVSLGAGHYIRERLEELEAHPVLYTPLIGYVERLLSASELLVQPKLWITQGRLGEAGRGEEYVREQIQDLRDLLRRRGNFVLVGNPGAGKTFTLGAIERIALDQYLAGESRRLPVYLPLNEWAKAEGQDAREGLKRFVCEQPHARKLEPIFDAYLDAGRFLFLCDALNEMPEYGLESLQVQLLKQWIQKYGETEEVEGFETAGREAKCRFFFTCRTENYQVTLPARRVDVAPLDDERIREMARRYLGEDEAPPFLAALRASDAWELCSNPMHLDMCLALYKSNRHLPVSRGALFRAMRDLLFVWEAKNSARWGVSRRTVEAGLKALGFSLCAERQGEARSSVDTALAREEANRRMAAVLSCEADADLVLTAARDLQFLTLVRVDRDFLDLDRVRFRHQRWQEFWAALQITLRKTPHRTPLDWESFLGRLWRERELPDRHGLGLDDFAPLPPPPPTGWEGPLLLLAGFHPHPDDFIHNMLKINPVLAARCLYEGRASVSPNVREAVTHQLVDILEDSSTGPDAIALRVRIAAGEALGHVGDPRFPVDARTGLVLPPMVEVVQKGSTARFVMGTTREDLEQYRQQLGRDWEDSYAKDEQPAHRVSLEGYAIGKYLVTYREFAQFVEDGGYDKSPTARWRDCWTQGSWEWLQRSDQEAPSFWNDPRYHKPNFPVVGVTRYEVVAYVNWLNRKTGRTGRAQYRLPWEAEWEYAARGASRRLWPWGDVWGGMEEAGQRCNGRLGNNYVSSTTPVGLYPLGATPEGIADMAGNVWEWCADGYGDPFADYPTYPLDRLIRNPAGPERGIDRMPRLRGGSWDSTLPKRLPLRHPLLARTSQGFSFFGFRCASSAGD